MSETVGGLGSKANSTRTSDTAVVFFVYAGCLPFLFQALVSISQQDDEDFDVILINDGIGDLAEKCESVGRWEININIIHISGTIPQIRKQGLKNIIALGYRYLIFGDADDLFPANRIRLAKSFLQHSDIVVNDIRPFGEAGYYANKPYFATRLVNNQVLTKTDLLNANMMGFTNTAIRASSVPELLLPDDLIAVDWALYAQLIEAGAKAVFTSETYSRYRIHQANHCPLGACQPDTFLTHLDVKLRHYQNLSQALPGLSSKFQKAKALAVKMKDHQFRDRYINYVMQNKIAYPFWWEDVGLTFRELHQ